MDLQEPQGATAAAELAPALDERPAGCGPPSPPQEAPATVGPLPADADAVAAEPDNLSAMESLPDELLELILSLVPTTGRYSAAGLMRLRRVSRQWARVVRSAAVWRHQTLEARSRTRTADHLALLDPCVPALDAVSVISNTYCREEAEAAEDAVAAEAALQALATTHCKIRCLTLTLCVNDTVAELFPRILEQHRHRLQELYLSLWARTWKRSGDPVWVLAVVAPMPELRTLFLRACEVLYHGLIKYDLSPLRGLQCLRLDYDYDDTTQSLLRANKDTLLEVECRDHDVFDLLAQCPRLRKVSTSAIHCAASRRLAEVRSLRTLVVSVGGSSSDGLRSLVSLLDSSPDVPAELHLEVRGFEPQFTLLQAAASMGTRLRSLWLSDHRLHLAERCLAAALGDLPCLEVLVFTRQTNETDWNLVVEHWTEHTAPALRELHVHNGNDPSDSRSLEWVLLLQADRPALHICTSNNDCPSAESAFSRAFRRF